MGRSQCRRLHLRSTLSNNLGHTGCNRKEHHQKHDTFTHPHDSINTQCRARRIMSRSAYSTTSQGTNHPDFQQQWIQDLLSQPDIKPTRQIDAHSPWKGRVFNSMFNETLAHESGLRAGFNFERPCKEPDAVLPVEDCYLLSLGTGLDGRPGRGHGGLTSLLMDQGTGLTAVRCKKNEADDPPATATLSVDYLAPIDTPGVYLMRSWVVELSGRKVWAKGVIQDCNGKLCATAKALFVHPRPRTAL